MRVEDPSGSYSFTEDSVGASWDGITFDVDLREAGVSLAEGEIIVCVTAADRGGHLATINWSFICVHPELWPLTLVAVVAANSGDPNLIDDQDILWAIGLWVEGTEVPGFGRPISSAMRRS